MLGTSMFAFKNASLTTILIIRNTLPILTFGCEKALYNRPDSVSWKVVMSLGMTLTGTVLYGFADISATSLGKVLLLINSLFAITDRLVQGHLLKGHADFSMSIPLCMLMNNTFGILPMLALAMVNGEIVHWRRSLSSADKAVWFLVLMSGMCGASLGYVGLRTQQLFSSTSVLMMQNFNKIVIILIGICVFHEHLTPMSLLGCVVSLLGCFTYGYLRLPAEVASKG
jgi:drug/metabolite transporter (DMT)-like permease